MCGIAGILNFDNTPVNPDIITKMTDVIKHRGPDDEGKYIDFNVGLGHRRLSIIDLSAKGRQPMTNEDQTIWIVYNGEIYNYKALNNFLISKGHQIKSNCDTETIIHLYEEYGTNCVTFLRGMFSFAIWDSKRKLLFAAVDRLRIKPFYYTISNNAFLFASELKAILATELIKPKLNYQGIHHYLSLQAIPAPETIYQDIFTLPGGCSLVVKDGNFKVEQYWDIPFDSGSGENFSEDYYKKKLYDMVRESVEIRMMSDVPLGAFLSGGIDSSIIVGLMKDMTAGPVKTFTIGYDVGGQDWDDTYYADLVSKKFNTDHTQATVTASDILNELKRFVWYLDQPSTDAFNSYFVSQVAAKDVTVVLCGQGGDELFAGYRTFDLIKLFNNRDRKWEQVPLPLRNLLVNGYSILPSYLGKISAIKKMEKFLHSYGSFVKKFGMIRMEMYEEDKHRIYSDFFSDQINGADTHNCYKKYCDSLSAEVADFDKISYLELKMHLGDILMRDVDVMSMAFSLETRIPLIDHKLVEFASTIPNNLKLKNNLKKYILIESMRGILPEEVINRKKRGFAFPFNIWLRNQLKPVVDFVLSKENVEARGLFKYAEVEKLKNQFYTNQRLTYRKVWGLVVLELWLKRTMENDHEYFDQLKAYVAPTINN